MKSEYIYCNSYQALIMALILRNEGQNIVILTSKKDLVNACEYLKVSYKILNELSTSYIVLKSFKTKAYIRSLFFSMRNSIVYFSHTQWDIFCFLLVKEFSKFETVKFLNFELLYKKVKWRFEWKFVKKWIICLIIRNIYRIDLIIKSIGNEYVYGIDDKFFIKNKIEKIDNKKEYIHKSNLIFKEYQIKLKNFDFLLLYEGAAFYSDMIITKLPNVLTHYLEEINLVIKEHPNNYDDKIFMPKAERYPQFLPAEFLYGNIRKAVLSFVSAGLINASIYPNLKAISLIDLVEWKDQKYSYTLKKELSEKSNNQILFPQNLQDLKEILC